jgi:transcriptional regulator with XRE-family HTH domain
MATPQKPDARFHAIAWRAATLRQLAGLDQAEAAKRAGITLRTWRNLEAGRPVSGPTIFYAAKAFDCCPGWLKYGTDDFARAAEAAAEEGADMSKLEREMMDRDFAEFLALLTQEQKRLLKCCLKDVVEGKYPVNEAMSRFAADAGPIAWPQP